MVRKRARSKQRNDATVKIGDAPARAYFDNLPPRHKKLFIEKLKERLEPWRKPLHPSIRQQLRELLEPELAGLGEEDLSRMRSGVAMAFSDLVANKDPGVIAGLAAKLKLDWPPIGSIPLAPRRLVIEVLLTDRKSRLATARAYIGDICLALLVNHDPPPVWTTLVAEYGVGRLMTLISLDGLDTMGPRESWFLVKALEWSAKEQLNTQRMQRAKRLEPLEKNRAKGVLRNKQRAAEAHAQLRQTAWDLYERHPSWLVQDVVDQIHESAGQVNGRTYSAATIRRAIKGVRQEWRKAFEARRKTTGLYTLDH